MLWDWYDYSIGNWRLFYRKLKSLWLKIPRKSGKESKPVQLRSQRNIYGDFTETLEFSIILPERRRWVPIGHPKCFTVSKNLVLITSFKPQNLTCDVGTIFNFTDKEAWDSAKWRDLLNMQLECSDPTGAQISWLSHVHRLLLRDE